MDFSTLKKHCHLIIQLTRKMVEEFCEANFSSSQPDLCGQTTVKEKREKPNEGWFKVQFNVMFSHPNAGASSVIYDCYGNRISSTSIKLKHTLSDEYSELVSALEAICWQKKLGWIK